MNKKLRALQNDILKIFSSAPRGFALAGGTALEVYYLCHHFSRDLDFFSPRYDIAIIDDIAKRIERGTKSKLKLIGESLGPDNAKYKMFEMRHDFKLAFLDFTCMTKNSRAPRS